MKTRKEQLRALKFALISISAGIIQIVVFTLLNELVTFPAWVPSFGGDYGPAYLIALVLSVLWNFTINRRYTFKSASNVPKAMLLIFLFYLVFTPATTIPGDYLTSLWIDSFPMIEYIVLVVTMVLNLVLEYLYCTFVVYRKSMDTNDLAKKA